MNIRTALLYRKNLATLIDESVRPFSLAMAPLRLTGRQRIAALPPEIPTYLTAVAPAPTLPPRIFCSVCGYWGRYKCMKCAMPYCDLNCRAVHVDTRCDKRVI
jgi:zinc finger HIT domain-containing protein 1